MLTHKKNRAMDQAEKTISDNLLKNTGKSIEQWIDSVIQWNIVKHSEIINYLKSEHGFTYGFANLIANKSKRSDAGSVTDASVLIEKQFNGKEHFKPVYDNFMSEIFKGWQRHRSCTQERVCELAPEKTICYCSLPPKAVSKSGWFWRARNLKEFWK